MNEEKIPTARTENLTKHSELKDTIELMTSNDYKDRFIAEYYQLLIRYDKLGNLIGLYYEYKLLRQEPPMFDCPIEILNMQYEAMEKLLDILVIRAKIENIEL